MILGDDGKVCEANPAACEMTGYSPADLVETGSQELFSSGDAKPAGDNAAGFPKSLARGERWRADLRLHRQDGSVLPVGAHAVGLENQGMLLLLRDISGRVAEEQALEQALSTFTALVELCHAAVISADEKGRVVSWNTAAEDMFGYRMEEAIGMELVEIIPERYRSEHLAGYLRRVASTDKAGYARLLVVEGRRKDGSELPVELSIAVGVQQGRKITTAIIRDLSEHRSVVEKLNDALQRLQFHVERMPLAFIAWDADFRVTDWNPAAERIFGYTKAEALDRHAYDIIVPKDATFAIDKVWADLLSGDRSSHSINANVRKDGTHITCEWFNTPLLDSAGRIHGVASMAMDVSERQRLEARIRDAQKLESLGVLTSGIAHDFNSSLMVILGNTTLLRSIKRLPGKALEYIDLIETAGYRGRDLIQHLLAYARTGRHNPQPTNLNEVIADAMQFLTSSIGQHHNLETRLTDPLPLVIADRSQVEQILLNLCLNAKQAMPKGGVIGVATNVAELTAQQAAQFIPYDGRPGRYVELIVEDTGCGMDQATIARVFDPFFTTRADGHGLGLAAVLGILRQHSGLARFDSRPGTGTRAHIYLPVAEDRESDAARPKTKRSQRSHKRRHPGGPKASQAPRK